VIYFSSNGLINVGGRDVFKANGSGSRFSNAENLGFPVNSSVDDHYFVIAPNENYGYFVSNRPGIIALKSETCCDDIFRYDWIRRIKLAVTGNVYVEKNGEKIAVDKAMVSMYMTENQTNEILMETDTLKKRERYFFDLTQDREYKLIAEKEGYLSDRSVINTFDKTESDTLVVDLFLKLIEKEKSFILQNIYYDYDQATLRTASKSTLDSLVLFLKENPAIIVELGAHTDNKGDDEYNKKLSQKRAESVVKYLITAGLSKDRLIAKGYGETNAIAQNENPDGSDNPEGRQLNRRTEFTIKGELDPSKVKRLGVDDSDEVIFEEAIDKATEELKKDKKKKK